MSRLRYENEKFIFTDNDCERVLLDCHDFLSNKSSLSMHRLSEQTFQTIPNLITELAQREQTIAEDLRFSTLLLDVLLSAQLIRTRSPIRLLEYGAGDGRISWHLTELLGAFHKKSTLVCAWNTFSSDWMERMADVESLPKTSFLCGDFGHMNELQENWFDIVFINGRTNFSFPDKVLQDALRLVSRDGMIFALIDETPLLESIFKLYFETREEYEMLPGNKILTAKASDCIWKA